MAVLVCWVIRFACSDASTLPNVSNIERLRQQCVARRLALPISVDYKDATLQEICQDVRARTGLKIEVDEDALREIGACANDRFSLMVENISVKTALNLVARQAQLCVQVTDASVRITSEARTRGPWTTVSYPVADLLVLSKCECEQLGPANRDWAKTLVKLVKTTIAPDTWTEGSGANVKFRSRDRSLVVHNCEDVQEQVGDLLAALRKLCDLTVQLDVRWITVPPTVSKIYLETPELRKQGLLLDRASVAALLAQARQDSWGVIGPRNRRTAFNGQSLKFQLPAEVAGSLVGALNMLPPIVDNVSLGTMGTQLIRHEDDVESNMVSLCPIVSADRQYVRLRVNGRLTKELPKGVTLALHGGYHRKPGGRERPVLILITSRYFSHEEQVERARQSATSSRQTAPPATNWLPDDLPLSPTGQ